MGKTAIVAGSTGLVGKHLVQILAESQEYESVIALVRKGSNFIHEGVFTIEVDYDNLSEYSEDLKAEDVFCCLGTTMKKAGSKENFYKVDYTYPLKLAKVAEKNNSIQFNIITASGAHSKSMFYYNRVKGDVEAAISNLDIFNINIFRPSLLLGERKEKRGGEQIGAALFKLVKPLMLGPIRRYRAIRGDIVAKAMFRVNQNHSDGIHYFESDRIQEIGQS